MLEPPFLLRAMLAAIRVVGFVVPRRDREEWRREWQGELLFEHRALTWRQQMSLARRASGSLADAAWLRRQFTRDSDAVHDLRHTLRLYRRTPGMVALVVGVLALGIGATTAVFSAVNAVLLKPVAFPGASRLVTIWQQAGDGTMGDVAPGNFFDWRTRATSFDILAAAEPFSRDYTAAGEPEMFSGAKVTEGFFDAFYTTPQFGRLLNADDYRLRRNVVVFSDALWRRRFGAKADVVGTAVRLDDEMFEIVGILPAGFEPRVLGGRQDVWTPKTVVEDYERRIRTSAFWHVVARVRPDHTIERAQGELDTISGQLGTEFPRTNKNVRAVAMTMRDHLAGGAGRPLLLFGLGSLLILLLALGSVVNLQLGLLTARMQEFAVRTALGAHRHRLVRQVFVESGTIVGFAVVTGVALAWGMLAAIRAVSPDVITNAGGASLNSLVLVFAAALGALAATLASVLPVMTILRSEVGSGVRGGLSMRGQIPMPYGRSALVVAQIAMALVLLVSAGLLGRSFVRLIQVDPGLRTDHLLALQVFAYDRQPTLAKRVAFFQETLARIAALPGVQHAGAASTVPFLKADIDIASGLAIHGQPPAAPDQTPRVYLTQATPDYFSTAAIPVRRGRSFTSADTADTTPVAIVNETTSRRHWPNGDSVGATIEVSVEGRKRTVEIVGVVGDVRFGGLDGQPRAEVFLPHAQSPSPTMTYIVRTSNDPAAMLKAVKQAVWSVDPLQTFYEDGAVAQLIDASLRPRVFALRLVTVFAIVGFVLALAGTYGAVSWALRRRTAEFGIRLALGAQGTDIRRHIFGYAGRLGIIGVAIGLAAALALGRAMRTFLFETAAADPVTMFAAAACVLVAVSAASYFPARRASRIDPSTALRT